MGSFPTSLSQNSVSKFNSILLGIIICLLGWTVKGVQDLKEQRAASDVMLSNFQQNQSKLSLDIEIMKGRLSINEIEIARLKAKLGIN